MSGQLKGKSGGKKRSKSYYVKCAMQKKFKRNVLEPGMKGFLVTCNSHEEKAVRECYNILNEYADKLYGPEKLSGDRTRSDGTESKEDSSNSEREESEEEDIEKALQKEVAALKETKPCERRFQRLDCSAKNCLFIKANIDDPSELGHEVLRDIGNTKVLKSRYALRLLPVQQTCKAFVEDILNLAETLLEPHYRLPFGESRTFSVLFKSRNNNSISREKIVPRIGQLIKEMNPLNSCDYHSPDRVVLVEVVCKVCCLGVVKDFYKFRKYNLHEVALPKPADNPSQCQSEAGSAENPPELTKNSAESDVCKPEVCTSNSSIPETHGNNSENPPELNENAAESDVTSEVCTSNSSIPETHGNNSESNPSEIASEVGLQDPEKISGIRKIENKDEENEELI